MNIKSVNDFVELLQAAEEAKEAIHRLSGEDTFQVPEYILEAWRGLNAAIKNAKQ